MEILTSRKPYVYSIQIFKYKLQHKLLPRIVLHHFVINSDVHDYKRGNGDVCYNFYEFFS